MITSLAARSFVSRGRERGDRNCREPACKYVRRPVSILNQTIYAKQKCTRAGARCDQLSISKVLSSQYPRADREQRCAVQCVATGEMRIERRLASRRRRFLGKHRVKDVTRCNRAGRRR